MSDVDGIIKSLKGQVDKAITDMQVTLSKMRTGRASLAVLDGIKVDYYGTPTPLSSVAALAVPEPRLITVKPWEKSIIRDIEKAIFEANIGLSPVNDGELIRLPVPAMTEDRRKDLAKQVKAKGEEYRVTIRNERRDANERIKSLLKDKKISEDDSKSAQEKTQKETDAGIKRIDEVVAKKEKEVMEV